jgi:hypothetical protein
MALTDLEKLFVKKTSLDLPDGGDTHVHPWTNGRGFTVTTRLPGFSSDFPEFEKAWQEDFRFHKIYGQRTPPRPEALGQLFRLTKPSWRRDSQVVFDNSPKFRDLPLPLPLPAPRPPLEEILRVADQNWKNLSPVERNAQHPEAGGRRYVAETSSPTLPTLSTPTSPYAGRPLDWRDPTVSSIAGWGWQPDTRASSWDAPARI